MTNPILENARQAYLAGDRADARTLCHAMLEDGRKETGAPGADAAIAALAIEFLDYEMADGVYARMVEREPESLDHRNHYATTLTQAGEFDRAEAQLRQALAINNGHGPSLFNLSLIHKARPNDALIAELEDLLRTPDLPRSDQYAYRLSLGKFYDDIGEFDEAFRHYDDAMRSARISYDHEAQKARFDKIKKTFAKAVFEDNSGTGHSSAAPIFLVGMPRSGSSLLETLLGADARIAAIGERNEISHVVENMARGTIESHTDEYRPHGADYCKRVEPLVQGAERFIDKNLLNFERAGLIRLMLPNATIIHTFRDPVDTCLSCYFQTLDPSIFPFTFDLAHIGQYHNLYTDLMSHWSEALPGYIVDAGYEDLVSDPDGVTRTLTEKTGLAPMKSENQDDKTVIATASAWQARQPVYETSVKRWKNYEKHLSPLFATLEQSGFQHPGA